MRFDFEIPDTLIPGLEYLRKRHEDQVKAPVSLLEFVTYTLTTLAGNGVVIRDETALIENFKRAGKATQDKVMKDLGVKGP